MRSRYVAEGFVKIKKKSVEKKERTRTKVFPLLKEICEADRLRPINTESHPTHFHSYHDTDDIRIRYKKLNYKQYDKSSIIIRAKFNR